jgi:NAD dependent epimerase/dehydratase
VENPWKARNVLVSGAGGFIASHLVEALVMAGASVKALVRYNSRGDPGLLTIVPREILENIEIIAGDLRDLQGIHQAVKNVDTVFHLGALIAIPYSYLHPMEVIETNILGTLNVLLAGRDSGVERIVHTSSSEVYGTALQVPISEDHPLQGQSPYSASKIGADKIAESFYCTYNTPVVILRPFNTYGPRQSTRAVIPTIITQALSQNEVRLGNLEAKRDLTFITDTIAGFLKAGIMPGIEGKTINLGTGREVSIRELVDIVFSLTGKERRIEVDIQRLRPEKSEVQRLISDNRLAKELLKWEPQISLEEGLTRTIEWISQHLNMYRSGDYRI